MTRRKLQSNRQNSARSTGPKSSLGKATSARNTIKHGLSGKPELTDTELIWFDHYRRALSDLVNTPESHELDIHKCAFSQVLLERIIDLRHRAHLNDQSGLHELLKLLRFENQLTKQRDGLLKILDVDEYINVDPEIWNDPVKQQ